MEATTLSKLYGLDGPFTTIYLDTSSDTEDAAARLEIEWKNIVRDLEQAGVDAATIEALDAARGDHTRGNTRVLVATPGTVHLAISLPQPPPRPEVVTGNLPRLVPLVDALSLQLPHVVVLADRKGADILAYTSGPDPEETASVTNDRFPHRKVHPAAGRPAATTTTSRRAGRPAPATSPPSSTASRVTSTRASSWAAATNAPCSCSASTSRPSSSTGSS